MASEQLQAGLEPTGPMAAIDIGSNSIRLIIADAQRDGKYRILDDEKDSARLGAKLGSTGRLSPEAVERAIATLRRMKRIVEGYQASQLRVIATCAVREAEDGPDFCRRVRDEIGLDIEVITARQEGRLAYASVRRHFDLSALDVLTADIGGGSTEMVAAAGGVIESIFTTSLGAVRFAERFPAEQRLTRGELEALTNEIDAVLQDRVGKPPFQPHLLIGTGGTFTTLGAVVMALKGQMGLPMRGYVVRRAEVRHTLDRLSKMSLRMRRTVPGLSEDRADIVVAGFAIIDRIMHHFEVNRLQIHTGGVRDGLLLTMVDELRAKIPHSSAPPADRGSAIERFAADCGVDLIHSRHVGRLAARIWSQLREPYDLAESDGALLESAALLQDVGYLINYEDHHKHSLHLILNSDLPGFSPQDLQVVANVCRYHRGSEPRRKHPNFAQLSDDQQLRVRRLAGVLRLAGGLDRSHAQNVRDVLVAVDRDRIRVTAVSPEEPEVDLWGARRRTEMLEKVFEAKIEIDWSDAEGGR